MPDFMRPHRPTIYSAIVITIVLILIYHLLLGRKR